MSELSDIKWALEELNPQCDRMRAYEVYSNYYDGLHELAFATEKFRTQFWRLFAAFSLNQCSSVVDIQAERLEIVGFTSADATVEVTTADEGDDERIGDGPDLYVVDDALGSRAWDAWEEQRLDLVSDAVHTDALKFGDGFLIAQPTTDGMAVWPQDPRTMACHYSEEIIPSTIDLAAKMYALSNDGRRTRWVLYIYRPGKVLRYEATLPNGTEWKNAAGKFTRTGPPAMLADDLMPVYHFPNKALGCYGVSELHDVMPIQDALNKTVIDMLVSSEFQAFRQRWVTGAEIDDTDELDPSLIADPGQITTDPEGNILGVRRDREHGPGSILVFPDPLTKVGEFGQADASPYVQIKNAFQADIARVSGVPLSYFFVSTSETPSGEALKAAEIRFTRKGRRQKRAFGNQWEHVVSAMIGATSDLNAVWMDDSPRSETEKLNALVLKQTMGVPRQALQKEMGYDDDEIAAFAKVAPATPPPAPAGPPRPPTNDNSDPSGITT